MGNGPVSWLICCIRLCDWNKLCRPQLMLIVVLCWICLWSNPNSRFSAIFPQLFPATHAEIQESYTTATSRGPRLTSGTKSATAVTRATCWKVTRPSLVSQLLLVLLRGTSPFHIVEVINSIKLRFLPFLQDSIKSSKPSQYAVALTASAVKSHRQHISKSIVSSPLITHAVIHEVLWGYRDIFLTVPGPHDFRLCVKCLC